MPLYAVQRSLFIGLLVAAAAALAACDQRPMTLQGETQGTTYHITLVGRADATGPAVDALKGRIEARLAEIDRALSNYREDSDLSRFNRAPVDTWIDIGPDLHAVLLLSARISELSGGAFDITAAPLASLWGFGPGREPGRVPTQAEIEAARAQIGFHRLEIDQQRPRARKRQPLSIDVDGIAQGYSVDQLAELLAGAGWRDYMVEIGGEIRLAGHGPRGRLWRIGIERPVLGLAAAPQGIGGTGIGITTAGDYRDYFESGGVRYGHTIDPATGRPAAQVASVTVVAATAAEADGLDTALAALKARHGIALARRLGVAAYFILRTDQGPPFICHTEAMAAYLQPVATAPSVPCPGGS